MAAKQVEGHFKRNLPGPPSRDAPTSVAATGPHISKSQGTHHRHPPPLQEGYKQQLWNQQLTSPPPRPQNLHTVVHQNQLSQSQSTFRQQRPTIEGFRGAKSPKDTRKKGEREANKWDTKGREKKQIKIIQFQLIKRVSRENKKGASFCVHPHSVVTSAPARVPACCEFPAVPTRARAHPGSGPAHLPSPGATHPPRSPSSSFSS